MAAAHHPVRRPPAGRSGRAGLARLDDRDAAQLDRPQRGRRGRLPERGAGRRARDPRLHDAARHALRRDVHGAVARAPAGRGADQRQPARRPCGAYQEEARRKSDLERTDLAKDKTGVFTGATATNPVNGKQVPIWIADYVLASYGTGAIMAVPAHDERDFAFAKKFGLPDCAGRRAGRRRAPWTRARRSRGEGVAVNSGPIDGLPTAEAKKAGHQAAGRARRRQGRGQLPAARLGVLAPALLGRAHPAGPLRKGRRRAGARVGPARAPARRRDLRADRAPASRRWPASRASWRPPARSAAARRKRETNTMPQWAGSCWYYLRYLDAEERRAPVRAGGREGVDAGRPVRRRRRARRAAPALRALLAQGALRHGRSCTRRSRSRSCATRGPCWRTATRTAWGDTTSPARSSSAARRPC